MKPKICIPVEAGFTLEELDSYLNRIDPDLRHAIRASVAKADIAGLVTKMARADLVMAERDRTAIVN